MEYLIASTGGNLANYKVGDIMNTGVITIRRQAYFFEAIFKMAKNNIHRLAVVDEDKTLVGVITDTDLLSLQTRSPLYLTQEKGKLEFKRHNVSQLIAIDISDLSKVTPNVEIVTGTATQATAAARQGDDKGRHTTTGRSLHQMPNGGLLLDTPGMRELQLVDVGDALGDVFGEITALADHRPHALPGCAVEYK